MIAHSTSSRALRMAGASLAVLTVGVGLGLTASGSIAAPSKVAPTAVKPLFQAQAQPQSTTISVADGPAHQAVWSGDEAEDGDVVAAASSSAAAAPVAAVAAIAPRAPQAPLPPAPPAPPSVLSADQVRQIHEASRQASEVARHAVAAIDVAAITREAMAQARAELARECRHAAPGRPNETDHEAIARLATGCVDMAEINREVQDALREAMDDIRDAQDMSEAERARALAAVERARSETRRHTGH